jgi:hypothetical protein
MRIGSALLCLLFFVIDHWQGHAQSDTGAIIKRQHTPSKPLSAQATPKEKYFTIYGKFINYNPAMDVSGFCRVFYQDIYNNHSASLRIAIDSAGNFRFRFPLLHSQEISIEHRNSTQWIFAKAGDSLYVQLELD